jgi:hypothetical protein
MPETKNCQNCKNDFIIEDEDFEFYKKMKVPAPTWCPECRAKRRMSFYNIRTLYKRKCDKCGGGTLSLYDDGVKFPVYCQKCWWKDDWDATEYAREYDFNKTFFEQFKELKMAVPRLALETDFLRMVNSPYVNACSALKNCYLVFLGGTSENCFYSISFGDVRDSMDCTNVTLAENSYYLFNCARIYNSSFLVNCNDCIDVHFSKNLINCQNCFGCVNLKNKSYYIFNERYSKEAYKERIKEFNFGSYAETIKIREKVSELVLQYPVKYMVGYKNEDVSGNYIWKSKDIKNSYGIDNGENVKYSSMLELGPTRDCYDFTNWGENANNVYETVHAGENVSNLKFNKNVWMSCDVEYSDSIFHSNNIFGSVFLNKKSYCILNKQYHKEKYFEMVEKIKRQMNEMPYINESGLKYEYGEFFPSELSLFAYNETIAQEFYPMTKEAVLKSGFRWKNSEKKDYQTTIEAKDLPDNIKDVEDSILKEVIGCKTRPEDRERSGCTTAFKIIPKELEFYKKMNIPLPRYCPNC